MDKERRRKALEVLKKVKSGEHSDIIKEIIEEESSKLENEDFADKVDKEAEEKKIIARIKRGLKPKAKIEKE